MIDGRRERGRLLAEDERIKHLDGPLWWVPSSTSGGYIVDVVASTCSCADHAKHGGQCKHLIAAQLRHGAPSAPVSPTKPERKPAKIIPRGLTKQEQANARRAMVFLRIRAGGWKALGEVLRLRGKSLTNAMGLGSSISVDLALRVARVAEVPVSSILEGRWPPEGLCPHCGRGP